MAIAQDLEINFKILAYATSFRKIANIFLFCLRLKLISVFVENPNKGCIGILQLPCLFRNTIHSAFRYVRFS